MEQLPSERAATKPAASCRRCGYDLRAGGNDKCPECGVPTSLSSLPAKLVHADPRWLSTLYHGLRWQGWRVLYDAAAIIAGMWVPWLNRTDSPFGYLTLMPSIAMDFRGTWLMTASNPIIAGHKWVAELARALRFLTITKCVIFALLMRFYSNGLPAEVRLVGLLAACEGGRIFVCLEYFRRVGRLGMAPATLRAVRRRLVFYPVALVGVASLLVASQWMPGTVGSPLASLLTRLIVSGFVTSVFAWSHVLAVTEREISEARAEARRVWSNAR